MKYYGTTVNGFNIPDEIREKYSLVGTHPQYRLVIKAKSRASANRRWQEVTGHTWNAFLPDYTGETGNELELELCDKYGEILGSLRGGGYTDLKVIVSEKNSLKETSNK